MLNVRRDGVFAVSVTAPPVVASYRRPAPPAAEPGFTPPRVATQPDSASILRNGT